MVLIDLERGSAREPFKLRQSDEDVRLNMTLLQKLEKEFRIPTADLVEIPEDEKGCDVLGYLRRVQAAVLNVPRWEVLSDMVRVGTFSFSKLLMWLDLQTPGEDQLLRQLLDGKFHSGNGLAKGTELDRTRSLNDCNCVVDADSSQLAAVYSSTDGQSFVLQGPPGTGKSQTITNIIAQNLGMGRSVLFVAEKLAALQVVHKRLSDVGLAPFCLELHSNKANKTDVMRQLGEALNLGDQPPEDWNSHVGELERLRTELNEYVDVLHLPTPLGYSVFAATSRVVQLEQTSGIAPETLGPADREHLDKCRTLLDSLRFAAQNIGTPNEHVWRESGLQEWDRSRARSDEEALRDLGERASAAEKAFAALEARVPIESWTSQGDLERLSRLARLLAESPWPTSAMIGESGWADHKTKMRDWITRGQKRQQLWSEVGEEFSPSLLELDLEQLRQSYQKWAGIMVFGWIMLWGPRKKLRKAARKGLRKARQMANSLEVAIEVKALDGFFQEKSGKLEQMLGRLWDGPQTRWNDVELHLQWSDRFRQEMTVSVERGGEKEPWQRLAVDEERNPVTLFRAFDDAWKQLETAAGEVRQKFQIEGDWQPSGP